MSKILYYLLLKPISYIPLGILYYLSDFLCFILFNFISYRKKVVLQNLGNSFPEKSESELNDIARKFYKHFCDVIVESIRLFSMPEKELKSRLKLVNPELLDGLYDQDKNIMIAAGHYSNWELAVVSFDAQSRYQGVAIYAPLANKFFNKKLKESRSQFGLKMISKKLSKRFFAQNFSSDKKDQLHAVVFASDQSPSSSKHSHWMDFLNQDTAVAFGTEKYAKETNSPVIFAWVTKKRRGYYEAFFELVEDDPLNAPTGSITEKHTRLLEKEIQQAPEYWLWTHKRWKRKRAEIDA